MPRPRLTPQEQALEELSESPYDEPDNDADDAVEMTPYRSAPSYGTHRGPAMDRYLDLDENLEREAVANETDQPLPGSMERLRDRYDAARAEAAAKGEDLPILFQDVPRARSAPYRIQPIGEEGIYHGNVALPGGGQAEDDELDAAGVLTRDLRRKGVPEVWQHQEAMNGAPFRNPGAPAQYTELPAFMNSLQGHRGPALERYGTFAGDTGDIQTAQAERMRALLYNEARDEAALKGVQLPADYYDDLGGGYVASVDAPAVHGDDPDAILEDLARMNDNRARAGRY